MNWKNTGTLMKVAHLIFLQFTSSILNCSSDTNFSCLKCQFFTKFASSAFDRYRTEISPINYFQKKYTYALIEISPMSKVCWILRSSWKHELKLSHYSSDAKGNALRTNVKIIKWNESFSRQRLSQSCLFKSLKIKTKTKENRTQQNYKFLPLMG